MWDYICPKCKKNVSQKTHKCPYCSENYGVPLRVPPKVLKDQKALEEYVHKHVFPKVSALHREYLTQFFTTIFNDGFESCVPPNFDLTVWTGTQLNGTGSIVTETLHPYQGTKNIYVQVFANNDWGWVYKDFAAAAIIYCRCYVKFKTLDFPSNTNHAEVMEFGNADETHYVEVAVINDSGTILWTLYVTEPNNFAHGTHTPVIDTWYCVEAKRDVTGSSQQLWIDGTLEVNRTEAITENTGRAKVGSWLLAGTCEFWADCVVVADAYIGPLGPEVAEAIPFKGWKSWWYEGYPNVRLARRPESRFPKFNPRVVC